MYHFPGESSLKGEEVIRSTEEMISYFERLAESFPIISIEDALAEDDWDGWQKLTQRLGGKVQLVGDDLFVTNKKRLAAGIKLGTASSILVKVNQIGTLTEAFEAVELRKLHRGHVPQIRGDRGHHHRGSGGGLGNGADQDRRTLPQRQGGKVQQAAEDRRGAGEGGGVPGPSGLPRAVGGGKGAPDKKENVRGRLVR